MDPFELVAAEISSVSERLRRTILTDIPVLSKAAEYFFKVRAPAWRAAAGRPHALWHACGALPSSARQRPTPRCCEPVRRQCAAMCTGLLARAAAGVRARTYHGARTGVWTSGALRRSTATAEANPRPASQESLKFCQCDLSSLSRSPLSLGE